jgi:hypothetical protein
MKIESVGPWVDWCGELVICRRSGVGGIIQGLAIRAQDVWQRLSVFKSFERRFPSSGRHTDRKTGAEESSRGPYMKASGWCHLRTKNKWRHLSVLLFASFIRWFGHSVMKRQAFPRIAKSSWHLTGPCRTTSITAIRLLMFSWCVISTEHRRREYMQAQSGRVTKFMPRFLSSCSNMTLLHVTWWLPYLAFMLEIEQVLHTYSWFL